MKKIKFIAMIFFSIVFLSNPAFAILQKVLIKINNPQELKTILSSYDFDITSYHPNKGLECLIDEKIVSELSSKGIAVEIILSDATKYYSELKSSEMKIDMGPYYTYPEALAEAYNLAALYPGIVAVPESIGASHEGRKIIAFSISKDPGSDNGNAGALYTGMHHAREPIGCSICFGFAKYLCENYETDSTVKYLVDNRQLWFIPIVNPDGYVFNTDSSEDGMWRKNRRDNGDSTIGVDLNRNYPYMWGYDDIGSSGITEDEVYRGPYDASEPEVQAVINFVQEKDCFKSVIDFHSYGNSCLYSWGYDTFYTSDDFGYQDLGREIARYNSYNYGTSWALLYLANGCSKDWYYGEQVIKPKTYALTFEVGEDFYQPDTNIIQEQIAENIWPCILTGLAADLYLGKIGNALVFDQDSNGVIEPGETASFSDSVKNHSMEKNANQIKAVLSSDDAYIDITQAAADLGDFAPRQAKINNGERYEIAVDSACPQGHRAKFYLKFASNYDNYLSYDGLTISIGNQADDYVFRDSIENGTMGWNHSGNSDLWHITTNAFNSPSHSWYCGNEGTWDYLDNMNCRLVSEAITVDNFTNAEFWHSYYLEKDYDFSCVEVSKDNGLTWIRLGDQFTGNSGGWLKQTLSLSGYSGSIRLGFRMYTDNSVHSYTGWHIDDIVVNGYNIVNAAPDRPITLQPCDAIVNDSMPILFVGRVTDPESVDIHYGYKIYSDSLLTQIYAETDSSPSDTSWQVPVALTAGSYWWRAYADDGKDRSLFSPNVRLYYSPSGIEQDDYMVNIPSSYAISRIHPNPLIQSSTINYQMPQAGPVCLNIYNIQGQLVKVLVKGEKTAGYHWAKWDGRDEGGRRVASGVYFCKLQANSYRAIRKMVVLK